MEKITVVNGAVPVYKFTLPEGTMFRDYAYISGRFLVDGENYGKTARVRAYGPYSKEMFADTGATVFLEFGGGETDRNGPYLVSNVIGSNTAVDIVSGGAGANSWFTLEFPLDGKRHPNYRVEHFPSGESGGDFYFCLGLGTGDAVESLTFYAADIALVSADGTRKVSASGGGFDKPAFASYAASIPALSREQALTVTEKELPEEKGGPVTLTVDTAVRHQNVTGFGGMSNAWSSPVISENDIAALYGENGLGYNIFRIIIYHEPDKWGELLPAAKKAQSLGAIILASPWTPPPEMKSNGSHIGGHLLSEHYGAYAAHLRSFVQYMADNGVKIDAVSLQNEPDIQVGYDSCDWTPEQMLEFVKGYAREIPGVLIIPGESFQFKRVFSDPLLNDPGAAENFDIMGGHIYGGGLSAYPLAGEKGKDVWMTEHLLNTHGNYPNDLSWDSAMVLAEEVHGCMEANFNAYIWWYLKRFYSMVGDGEYGAAEGQILNRGYVMSHYAKYATGTRRVEARAEGNPKVLATAYESEGGINMVIVNMGTKPAAASIRLPAKAEQVQAVESTVEGCMRQKPVRLDIGKKSARLTLPPRSIISVSFE